MTILLTVVLGSNLFMTTAVARDRGKIGFGRHTKYYGSAVHHGKFWCGVGYHARPTLSYGDSKYSLGRSVRSLRRAGPDAARPHGEARKQQAVAGDFLNGGDTLR
jgi:hypothetical protein